MKPLVSIITVSYNSEETISDTINSVLNQTYSNIEYIIVDGLSQDNTLEIAKSYEGIFKDKNLKYKIVSEADEGIYDAMNKGIKLANGVLIGLINSDDWYEADAIEKVVNNYQETKFDLFYADLRIIKNDSRKIKKARHRKVTTSRDWNHPTMFVHKNVYEKYLYTTGKLYSDFELWLKVRNSKLNIVILNEVLANYRLGGISNQKSIKSMLSRIKERYCFYRENGFSKLYILECIALECMKYILS